MVEQSKKLLDDFTYQEYQIKQRSESKNKLESMIYLVSEKLGDDDFTRFLCPADKDSLAKQSADNDDWLYSDEAEDSDYLAFNKRT
jgi:molecular chaperone DnaK (HSP70)